MLGGNPIDLAEEMSDYSGFAICLLEDKKGNQFGNIKEGFGPRVKNILNQVFTVWLNGKGKKPVSWRSLIECYKNSGHNKLMKDMRAVLGVFVSLIHRS